GLPLAPARRQEHGGGLAAPGPLVGAGHGEQLCLPGGRKGRRVACRPHKSRHRNSGVNSDCQGAAMRCEMRPRDSDSVNLGSNPSPPANKVILISSTFLAFLSPHKRPFSCRACCIIFPSNFNGHHWLPAAPRNMNATWNG